jgi:exosortase A
MSAISDNGFMAQGAAGASRAVASPSAGLRWPLFLGAIVLTFIVYWPTLASILRRWTGDPTYSHGYLVAAVSAWMIWRVWRRGELERTQTSWLGLAALALAGLVWLMARGASIQVIQQLALPALLLGVAWTLFGWRGFVALLVPIGVLYFVLPVWDYIRNPLQSMTVVAVGESLHAIGIPAFIHGYRVDLPGGSFEVVEGCSGLHFFMAAGALAAIQAYLYLGAFWARAVLMSTALAVAIIANWIRVAVVIIAGHLTEMQTFLIKDHYYFGWVVFALLMIPVIYFGRRLEDKAPAAPAPAPQPPLSLALPAAQRAPAVAALLVLLLPGFAWAAIQATATLAPPPVLPQAAGEWRLEGAAAADWQPLQPGTSLTLDGQYRAGAREVDAWVVYYERQATGRELIGYGNRMARPGDGRLTALQPGELKLVTGKRHDRLIWYRYNVAGQTTTSATQAKLNQLRGNLGGRPSAYGVIFSARCGDPDCADARDTLRAFEAALGGQLPGLRQE